MPCLAARSDFQGCLPMRPGFDHRHGIGIAPARGAEGRALDHRGHGVEQQADIFQHLDRGGDHRARRPVRGRRAVRPERDQVGVSGAQISSAIRP